MLDNAASTSQVKPLLPGGSTSTVLVTSRHRLDALLTHRGAHPVRLDVLTDTEGRSGRSIPSEAHNPTWEPVMLSGLLAASRVVTAEAGELTAHVSARRGGVHMARWDDERMMRRKPSARSASLGVTRTRLAVEEELGWLFREQPTEDFGIDAHIEVVDGEIVKGKLLALQIKSGKSFFQEQGSDGWWFRPDDDHVRYWTNHSLPVVLVMYHPETEQCHWQLINGRTLVETTTGGWKVLVPERQTLNESARGPLRVAAGGYRDVAGAQVRRSTGVSGEGEGGWYRLRMPENVRTQVISAIYRRADDVGWDRLAARDKTKLLEEWVDDPAVGGVLSPYFPAYGIRVWLKDAPLKEYSSAKEGIGPYAQYVTMRYQTPDEIVLATCGAGWSVEPGTVEFKPWRCSATNGNVRRHVLWGEVSAFKHLLYAALDTAREDSLKPIVVLLHRENQSVAHDHGRRADIASRAQIKLTYLVRTETSNSE